MDVFDPLNSEYKTQLFATIGKSLYLNSDLADVHFVFQSNGESERIPAHKSLLMAGSDVFATMFNGSWKEKKEIKMGDTSIAAFMEFLQFFYFDQVKLTMENVSVVIHLGKIYNVTECLAVCSKFLKNNLSDDNVCRYYGLATLLDQEDLKTACETFIGFHTRSVLKSPDFLSCDLKTVTQILKLNWLSCTEIELFEACMAWVKAASNQDVLTKELVQTHLGDLFHEFRFGSITFQQFAALIPAYGKTFSFDEQQEIIQMIADPAFQPKIFDGSRMERCALTQLHEGNEILCDRMFSKCRSYQPYKLKSVETTVFSSNEPLLLEKIVFLTPLKRIDNQYRILGNVTPMTISVAEVSDPNNKAILSNAIGVLTSSGLIGITLTKPVFIKAGLKYEIRLEQDLPEDLYTLLFLKSKVELESGTAIQFHDESVIDQNITKGIICKLIFQAIS